MFIQRLTACYVFLDQSSATDYSVLEVFDNRVCRKFANGHNSAYDRLEFIEQTYAACVFGSIEFGYNSCTTHPSATPAT